MISCVHKCQFQIEGMCSLKELPALEQIELDEGKGYCPYFANI